MKYPKPISDATYMVYKSHLRKARKMNDAAGIKEWEDKIRLSYRPIPIDVDPNTVPKVEQNVAAKEIEERPLNQITDAAYTSYCHVFKQCVERGDKDQASVYRILIEMSGREVPQIGEITDGQGTTPNPDNSSKAAD